MWMAGIVFIVLALAVLAAAVWMIVCSRVIMQKAKPYPAEFVRFEEQAFGRKKQSYYVYRVEELEREIRSIHPVYKGILGRKFPVVSKTATVYYNDAVHNYCCIKGNRDLQKFCALCGVCSVVLVCLAVLLWI